MHLGFQLTVSFVIYPALADAPETHNAHGRRITPVVVVVYGLLAGACGWAVLTEPHGWTIVSVVAAAVAALLTAFGAAPLHGRLGKQWSRPLVHRLLLIDRLRTVAAAVAVIAAIVA